MLSTAQVTMQATDLAPRLHPASHHSCTSPQAESVEGQVLGLCQPLTRLNQPASIAQGEYAGGEQL